MGARVKAAAAGHFLTLDIRQYHLGRDNVLKIPVPLVLISDSERGITP